MRRGSPTSPRAPSTPPSSTSPERPGSGTRSTPTPRRGSPPDAAQKDALHNGAMQNVTAVAHRGDPYRVRENTIDSLRSALRRGADAVEIDVRLTRDGVPVLLHDATLKRLWGHEVRLDRLTHAELTELTRGGVPTLREALLAAGAHRVMVDLTDSTDGSVPRSVGVVRECGAGERV